MGSSTDPTDQTHLCILNVHPRDFFAGNGSAGEAQVVV